MSEPAVNFPEFVDAHQSGLLKLAMVLTGDAALSADIVADVWDRVFERWPRVAAMDLPAAYVRRMVVNDYLSWCRRRRRLVPLTWFRDRIDPSSDHSDQHAERSDMMQRLATLPPRQRATLVLRFYQGLSDLEIADTLGCSPSTVRSNAARALATLRTSIESAVEPVSQEK